MTRLIARKCLIAFAAAGLICSMAAQAQEPTAAEIVQNCDYKNPGNDQRSKLTITLIDKDGNERKNVYLRLWKDYGGQEQVADKMVLFTEYPPDARGSGFMRWAFTAEADKNADQWIYLPVLRKTRRVAIRDPGDSFLGSDLTYADISGRSVDQDEHTLLKTEEKDGEQFYLIESKPKESAPLYSKRVSWFTKADWNACKKVAVHYYDTKGLLLKKQALTWQQVDDAWLWKRVEVENVQTKHKSVFEVDDAEVNVGLDDEIFTERTLKTGYRR